MEEPMYIIFNVALPSSSGSPPPNAGSGSCHGDGSSLQDNAFPDFFPVYLRIGNIRVYQDTSDNTDMMMGCDISSHPNKQWIEDNIDDYTNTNNSNTAVSVMAFYKTGGDCSIDGLTLVSTDQPVLAALTDVVSAF